jgi:hypothetical protein
MFHYLKTPYFTCNFFTKFTYNEYIGPYFLSHVVLRFLPSDLPELSPHGDHSMCTPLGGPVLCPPPLGKLGLVWVWSMIIWHFSFVHVNMYLVHQIHYICIHYICINACFHCIYKYNFEYNNTTPIKCTFLILQTKIILYITTVEINILKSRYCGIQSVYI